MNKLIQTLKLWLINLALLVLPRSARLHYYRGVLLNERKDWETALRAFQRSIDLNPDEYLPHHMMGEVNASAGEIDEAVEAFQKALALHPGNPWTHYHLGLAQLKQERWEAAAAALQRATHLDPGFCWSHYYLGEALARLRKWDASAACYRKSIQHNPTFLWGYAHLADVLIEASQWKEAESVLTAGLQQHPKNTHLQFKLDNVREMLKERPADTLRRPASANTHNAGVSTSAKAVSPAQQNNHAGNGQPQPSADLIITVNEVNRYHGVGIMLLRIFTDQSRIISLRSRNDYAGNQQFGKKSLCLNLKGFSAEAVLDKVRAFLKDTTIQRIYCVPYSENEILLALTVKAVTGAKLCTQIMDDQNIHHRSISDAMMKKLLERSELRLAISPELKAAYEAKYRQTFSLLPPVIPAAAIKSTPADPSEITALCRKRRGVLLGNVWSKKWLTALRKTIRNSGIEIDWFGAPNPNILDITEAELLQDGITLKGYVAETELIAQLQRYSFAVLPTASGEDVDERPELAKLSLPSRLPFITAVSHTPILVLGSEDTAAAGYVKRFGLGRVCEYGRDTFIPAVKNLLQPSVQQQLRKNAASLAQTFSAEGIEKWIWASLEQGKAADKRFDGLMPRLSNKTSKHIEVEPTQTPISETAVSDQQLPFSTQYPPMEVIVSECEINDRHEVGIHLKRIFERDIRLCSVRVRDRFGGKCELGAVNWNTRCKEMSREGIYRKAMRELTGINFRRVLCVPDSIETVFLGLAIRDIFGVKLCTYVISEGTRDGIPIPNELLLELFQKSSLCLANSDRMRRELVARYNQSIWVLPPLAPKEYLQTHLPKRIFDPGYWPHKGIMIGDVAKREQLNMIRKMTRQLGRNLHWFGGNHNELGVGRGDLESDGIIPRNFPHQSGLVEKLRAADYLVLPTKQPEVGSEDLLSLSSWLIYAFGTANIPIIVLGSNKSADTRFVERYQVGQVCAYDAQAFVNTVEALCQAAEQRRLRQNARDLAVVFSSDGIDEWIWLSLENNEACDHRFERLFRPWYYGFTPEALKELVGNDQHPSLHPTEN